MQQEARSTRANVIILQDVGGRDDHDGRRWGGKEQQAGLFSAGPLVACQHMNSKQDLHDWRRDIVLRAGRLTSVILMRDGLAEGPRGRKSHLRLERD